MPINNILTGIIHCLLARYFWAMHIGEKVKARAKELRMGPTELARAIKTSKQNIYGIYLRETIDTGLLQKLGKALDFDFFAYYGTTGSSAANTPAGVYAKRKKGVYPTL